MSAVTINTGDSDTARLTWNAASVTPPTLGQNFLITCPFVWRTPTVAADHRIFAIPSASGSGADCYPTLTIHWSNSGSDAVQAVVYNSSGAAVSDAFVTFDGVLTPTPALLVIRGVANGSDTDITFHAEVYGDTPETGAATLTGSPATPTTDGDWGFGDIATEGGAFTTMTLHPGVCIRNFTALPFRFDAYASAGAVPSIAAIVASVKANPGNIMGAAAFGSPSATVRLPQGYSNGNAGGTASFTGYTIGTEISTSVLNPLSVRNAAGGNNNQIRYDASVSGTHLIVDPFALSSQYARLTPADPVSGLPTTGYGTATKLSRYKAGTLARLNTAITGQSWGGGQGSSPLSTIESGLGCGNDFTQGYIAVNRQSVVGMRLLKPIQSAATTSRHEQYRIGNTTTDSNGLEDTFTSNAGSGGTSTNYADWYEWGHDGSGGVNTGNPATTGASSVGGYPMVGTYTDSSDAEFQCGFDLSKFARIGLTDGVTVEAGLIRYGGGPIAVVVSGETRPGNDIHGNAASAAATFSGGTVNCDSGEGTQRDLVSVSNSANTATLVFSGVEADIDDAEVTAANADATDPDLPRWVAYIHDTVTGNKWLKPIRTATWNGGGSEWTITFTPAFHELPTAAATTKVRCSRWSLVFQTATGCQDGTNAIRGVRVKKTGASGGGPMVCPFIGWFHPTDAGEVVSFVGTGGYAYNLWDTLNVPGMFWRMLDAVSLDRITMMNTAVPNGAGHYDTAITRFRAIADSVIGYYVPQFQASFTDANPFSDATSREEFRESCASASIPYYDNVLDAVHPLDAPLLWTMADPTHFSALGYYQQAQSFSLVEGTIALHTSTASGRTRGRSRSRGAFYP